MSKAKLLTALGLTAGTTVIGRNLYKAHQQAQEEAKKEIDPVETTLDAAEEYMLDPADNLLDNITPGKAAAGLATLAALGYGGNYLYNQARKKDT